MSYFTYMSFVYDGFKIASFGLAVETRFFEHVTRINQSIYKSDNGELKVGITLFFFFFVKAEFRCGRLRRSSRRDWPAAASGPAPPALE